jgi:hypothetical protein
VNAGGYKFMMILKFLVSAIIIAISMLAIGHKLQKLQNKFTSKTENENENETENVSSKENQSLAGVFMKDGYFSFVVFTMLAYLTIFLLNNILYIELFVEKSIEIKLPYIVVETIKLLMKLCPTITLLLHQSLIIRMAKANKKNWKTTFPFVLPSEDEVIAINLLSAIIILIQIFKAGFATTEIVTYFVGQYIVQTIIKKVSSNTNKKIEGKEKEPCLIIRLPITTTLLAIGYLVLFVLVMFEVAPPIITGCTLGIFVGPVLFMLTKNVTKEMVKTFVAKNTATMLLIVILLTTNINK